MKNTRIVARIEISNLLDADLRLDYSKLDRLAMMLSNLRNSGIELLLVSSGAIALGSRKLDYDLAPDDVTGMMAMAAVGQAELIKLYQQYFDQYNQRVAQVLLTKDIMENPTRKLNTQNTFEMLLQMNFIPIINENDAVSTSDIELNDNYPLALNVATLCHADLILIKLDDDTGYIVQPRNGFGAQSARDEESLICKIDDLRLKLASEKERSSYFPPSIDQIAVDITK